MSPARALRCGLGLTLLAVQVAGAGPVPVIFQSAPGRFEVAAIDATAAQAVVAQAEEAWRWLAAPLALPEAFSSPVFVRLVPAAEWSEPRTFRVIVEAGGVVSVRLRWSEAMPEPVVRRALVQALLLRIAVARYGANERLTAPRWVEEACVGWWQTRAEAAQLDALKQETARQVPPPLKEVLNWSRGAADSRELTVGAVWLLALLQEESTRAGEWAQLLGRLLGGDPPATALAEAFPGRFADETARELWWQTGWHQLRRGRTLPSLEPAESRAGLAELARFVWAEDGRDRIVPLREVLAHGREPAVAAELRRRATALNRLVPALHPFYRNAGLSLAEALDASDAAAERREASCAAFERDWQDATELEATTAAALDVLERPGGLSSIK